MSIDLRWVVYEDDKTQKVLQWREVSKWPGPEYWQDVHTVVLPARLMPPALALARGLGLKPGTLPEAEK